MNVTDIWITRQPCSITRPCPFLTQSLRRWHGSAGKAPARVAAVVIIGVAVPPLGVLKPLLPASVFLLLVLTFLRVDPDAIRVRLARPGLVIGASLWVDAGAAGAADRALLAGRVQDLSPELFVALLLQAVSIPMMSSPAIAAIMGLDAALRAVRTGRLHRS